MRQLSMVVLTYKRKLDELFPPDDPRSSWMLRLAILRDDLQHEYGEIEGEPGSGGTPETVTSTADLWRTVYATRRICVTLDEIRNILVHDAPAFIKERRVLHELVPIPLQPAFELALSTIEDARAQIKPIRDALGGHVRPKNAAAKGAGDPTPDLLRAHGDGEVEVSLDPLYATKTDLRELNLAALLFAWPDVRTDTEVDERMETLIKKIGAAFIASTRAIDVILAIFWGKPSGAKLG